MSKEITSLNIYYAFSLMLIALCFFEIVPFRDNSDLSIFTRMPFLKSVPNNKINNNIF